MYFPNLLRRYVGGSRRELSGVKELVTSRRVQKNRPSGVARSDGGCIGGVSPGSGGGGGSGGSAVGGVVAGGLLGGCSGGNDALAELTIEELASIPAGNHTSANHTGHPSHHKVSEPANSESIARATAADGARSEIASINSYFLIRAASRVASFGSPFVIPVSPRLLMIHARAKGDANDRSREPLAPRNGAIFPLTS